VVSVAIETLRLGGRRQDLPRRAELRDWGSLPLRGPGLSSFQLMRVLPEKRQPICCRTGMLAMGPCLRMTDSKWKTKAHG